MSWVSPDCMSSFERFAVPWRLKLDGTARIPLGMYMPVSEKSGMPPRSTKSWVAITLTIMVVIISVTSSITSISFRQLERQSGINNMMCVAQVAKRELSMECDYEYEARCQKRFKKLVSSDPELAESFNVPDIIDELSGKTVITSEWVPGVHIDKVTAITLGTCMLGV